MPRSRPHRRREETERIPRGEQGLPEYDQGACPSLLVTRRQLRDRGLCPGRGRVVAILRCKGCRYTPQWACTHRRRAWLYDLTAAKPKRVPTLAQEWALDRAMAARSTCPKCRRRYHFCLPLRTQGVCDPCDKGYEPSPDTYLPPTAPVPHRLAA
ncbi:RRQRL motif-containing zinc-binding protein [Streptomyces sp. NPDC057456]|uniref:RRQRL motif-containing zinc-binding protein n=1 Tax=Streptomyces sp. NPDC057456 TaxID=3346139 RepID=UPI0036C522B0